MYICCETINFFKWEQEDKNRTQDSKERGWNWEGQTHGNVAFPNQLMSIRVFTYHCFILHKYYTYSLYYSIFNLKKSKEKPPTDAVKLTKTNL